MALFLVVLGGAAVVEVHRAITGGGNRDLALLRQKEETLRRQLQVGWLVFGSLSENRYRLLNEIYQLMICRNFIKNCKL